MGIFRNRILLLSVSIIVAISQYCTAEIISPEQDEELNHTHVFFSWGPIFESDGYRLQIAINTGNNPFENSIIHDTILHTSGIVIESGLDWGVEYVWKYWGLDETGATIAPSGVYSFSTAQLPDVLTTFEVEIYDSARLQPGITIFGVRLRGYLAAVDVNGDCIWFLGGADVDLDQLSNGNMLFNAGGTLVESDIHGNIVFKSANLGFHHEVEKLPNGNYLGLLGDYRDVAFPSKPDSSKLWRGDKLVELNPQGEIVWSWSTFDGFTTEDHDSLALAANVGYPYFDWTHGNTAHMNTAGDAIIMSFRYLDRLTLVSYPEGIVIWNIGDRFQSGEALYGKNVNFSDQHDCEFLTNGNIILYDNHNDGPELGSRALEISIDFDRDPVVLNEWEYWTDRSNSGSDADRLENGNTLITGMRLNEILEVTYEGEAVWRLKDVWATDFGAYRSDRVNGLFPLAFTINGPKDKSHVPEGESYFYYTINNLGSLEQEFLCRVDDSNGWFQAEVNFRLSSGESAIKLVSGTAEEAGVSDTVFISVSAKSEPEAELHWESVLVSDTRYGADTFDIIATYPNPFNTFTHIQYRLLESSPVSLEIFDLAGRRVRLLLNEIRSAGEHIASWDGTTDDDFAVNSGVYILRLSTQDISRHSKILLIK
ncbi:aryl-sulfate sulfotransferase [Calditrichota bacterium]